MGNPGTMVSIEEADVSGENAKQNQKASGKHTENDGKTPFLIGKSTYINYFDGHVQKQTVSLPEVIFRIEQKWIWTSKIQANMGIAPKLGASGKKVAPTYPG